MPPSPPPFVPPAPPRPSQSNIPGAFTLTTPLTSPTAVFEFHPSFGFTEEYTDNFRLTGQNRTSNFRSSLRAGFTLLINAPKTTGSITTSMAVSQDSARDSTNTQFFPSLTGTVRHTFDPRLSVTVTDSFTRSDEPSQADAFGLRRERRTFASNSFSLSADWLIDIISTQSYYRNSTFFSREDSSSHGLGTNASTRLGELNTVRVGYELSLSSTSRSDTSGVSPTASGSQSTDSVGHLVLASLSRQIGQFGSAGVSTSYSIQSRNDSRVWNISLTSTYGLPTGLSVSSSLGYSRLTSGNASDSNAVSANTSASYRFTKAVISLGISQDFRQTFVEGQDFGIVLTRSYTGRFSYPLTPLISSSLFATYSENEPTGASTGVGTTGQRARAAKQLSAGFNLSWPILRWLSMSLNYSFSERFGDASIAGTGTTGTGSSRENRASLNLGASF